MTHEDFNKVVKAQLKRCAQTLITKGDEYADDKTADRLKHFKKAAVLIEGTPKEAVLGMLSKHLVSISDMVTGKGEYSKDRWNEKISDSMNYLIILRALIEEEAGYEQN